MCINGFWRDGVPAVRVQPMIFRLLKIGNAKNHATPLRMKLEQGQIWSQRHTHYRIVERARLSVTYKEITDITTLEGKQHVVSKKEFCKLIKGAKLIKNPPTPPTPKA